VKRLEAQGWETHVRDRGDNVHPLVLEAWKAMDEIYGLGVLETPLEASPWLHSAAGGTPGRGSVLLKLETRQVTGSFKARGASHKLLSLDEDQLRAGIVASSTGNHALALLHAVSALQRAGRHVHATIFVPSSIAPQKRAKLQAAAKICGAEIVVCGEDCLEAETRAREEATRSHKAYVSPYNDLAVAGGQGTIAIELMMALPPGKLDAVFVPVGGGGLVAGIASVLKWLNPLITVYGCQPARSDVMRQSVLAGHVVEAPWQDTLSDGTAGGIEENSLTVPACSRFVDEWITVEEPEIAAAMVGVHGHHGMVVEGSAGVAVASFLKVRDRMQGKHAIIVCCGGNVSGVVLDKAYEIARQHQSGGAVSGGGHQGGVTTGAGRKARGPADSF